MGYRVYYKFNDGQQIHDKSFYVTANSEQHALEIARAHIFPRFAGNFNVFDVYIVEE